MPAPHAGLHTAPHTPLRTALLRLAHAANQRAELRGPIRVAQRRAAQLERGAGRGGLLPRRAAVFPAVPRARPFPPGTSAPDRSRALPAKFRAPRDPVPALVIFAAAGDEGCQRAGLIEMAVINVGSGKIPVPFGAQKKASAARPLDRSGFGSQDPFPNTHVSVWEEPWLLSDGSFCG